MANAKVLSKSFTVRLEAMPGRLRWVIAYIPLDVKKTWGTRGRVKVRGEINGFPFRTSLFPSRSGRHFLLVNKTMQRGAAVRAGDSAKVRMENDTEIRTIGVPQELERRLKQSKALRKWFDELTYSIRNDICRRVAQPTSAEARNRRAEATAEMLYSAMDAERDLPPQLRAAFAHRPRAQMGWARLSATQRRHQLLGIFYYQNPESRARRIEKALDLAEACFEKSRA